MTTRDAERLAAGLDEDERIATDGAKYEGKDWRVHTKTYPEYSSVWDDDGANDVGDYMMAETATFVARNDPRRALRDIAAKRSILALYEEFAASLDRGWVNPGRPDDLPSVRTAVEVLSEAVAALAAVYTEAEETAG